jgi:hypothetical protein
MFGGQFGACQKGWEDGLCTTLADFSSNKSAPANRKKGPPKNMENMGLLCLLLSFLAFSFSLTADVSEWGWWDLQYIIWGGKKFLLGVFLNLAAQHLKRPCIYFFLRVQKVFWQILLESGHWTYCICSNFRLSCKHRINFTASPQSSSYCQLINTESDNGKLGLVCLRLQPLYIPWGGGGGGWGLMCFFKKTICPQIIIYTMFC